MDKPKVKIPAKINLTLDVGETKNGFHQITSLVTSINIYDTITVKKRKDNNVTLMEKGIKSGCSVTDNNAYKGARLYKKSLLTTGVDIVLDKKIPVGAGLGGSSADIAGVIIAMENLFEKNADLVQMANELGSDSGYMVKGGVAVLSERGNVIQNYEEPLKLNLLIITEKEGVSTKECYKLSDEMEKTPSCTSEALEYYLKGDYDKLLSVMKNDLYSASKQLLPSIEENIKALESVGADKAIMTGSGSAVYGIFKSIKKREEAYKKLLPTYGDRLIKAKTL